MGSPASVSAAWPPARYRSRGACGKPPAQIEVQTRRSVVTVEEPADGVCRNYGQLVAMLRRRRTELGMAQPEADERAGFESGYIGKLEQPNAGYGRRAAHESFDVWFGTMPDSSICSIARVSRGRRRRRTASRNDADSHACRQAFPNTTR